MAVLMESNQEFLAAFLSKSGLDEETSQIHAQTFFAGLKGATISEVEIVEEKKLGSFLAQFTIALRSSSNAYLFWRLHVLRSSLGHHIYNMSMEDDLTEYFPDWMDP